MSGPKISQYELERRRKEVEKEKQRQLLEKEMQKVRKEMAERQRKTDEIFNSVDKMLEQEKKRQQERQKSLKLESVTVKTWKSAGSKEDISKTLDFQDLLAQASQDLFPTDTDTPDMQELLNELEEAPVALHSLLDTYIPKEDTKTVARVEQTEEFDELLLLMENEYKEMLHDRAFFKQRKEQIVAFEEVCKRQQEYHSYQILKDVYYGEFSKLKKARTQWHKLYDQWKEPFESAYIQYRASCEMLKLTPKHYFLNVETVEKDIEELNAESKRLQEEYLKKQESLIITQALNEVMAEMGYEVLGKKSVLTPKGTTVDNIVFSYGEGSGIHVVDNGQRITMEVVGIDDENRSIDEEEKEYLVEEQKTFCNSFREIEEALEKKGVVLKQKLLRVAPSKEYSSILNLEGYTMTEQSKKVKKLSYTEKKGKTNAQTKETKYMN